MNANQYAQVLSPPLLARWQAHRYNGPVHATTVPSPGLATMAMKAVNDDWAYWCATPTVISAIGR